MEPIYIPTLLFWENKNTWYGSKGLARFFIKPITVEPEGGAPENRLEVELWRGPLSKALSEIITTTTFPVSEDGLTQLTDWLEEQASLLN